MAIVENYSSEIGDVILIQATSPIFGIIQLESFVDTTIGETGTRFFDKQFSYSIDGIFFSDWLELNDYNLQQIIVDPTDAFYINYKYTRSGTDATSTLSFVDITLTGEFNQPLCANYYLLPKSIFQDLFCYNPEHAHLCAILTNKLFEKGILPDYIIRNQTDNPAVDDEDFLTFWGTVCCFYALILLFGKKIENFDGFEDLLQEYLRERDIQFCNDVEIQDLQYIKSYYFDELRQRGTFQIFVPKGINKAVDGEFLRMICYEMTDEFTVELITGDKLGWWLGQSSPSYRGSSLSNQLVKNDNKQDDIFTVNDYNTYIGSNGSIQIVADGSKSVALLSGVDNGSVVGFAPDLDELNATDFDMAIPVDENVDYEITFWVKQNVTAPNITFGCYGFDLNNNNISFKNVEDNTSSNFFVQKIALNQNNVYYFVRGIIYNKNQPVIANSYLNIGYGHQLKSVAGITKIIPYLVLDRTSNPDRTSNLSIWAFKVRPLVKGVCIHTIYSDNTTVPKSNNTPVYGAFGTCFQTSRNLLHIMYKNNNASLQTDDIDKIAREKLIPYNSTFKTSIINN